MQRPKKYCIAFLVGAFLVVALLVLPSTTSSQHKESLTESTPAETLLSVEPQTPLKPRAKFMRAKKPIPNRYIVVLDDDVASKILKLESRRERIRAVANSHALKHLGVVDFIYETALNGFAIELPDEAAAKALSNAPGVKWVEEDGYGDWDQAPPSPQPSPPWGLDSIDGSMPAPAPNNTGRNNGFYFFNGNGTNVTAYVLDSGINTQHQAFSTGFFSRATEAADCFAYTNCVGAPQTSFFNLQTCAGSLPNSSSNDCFGHGTHVAGTIGGNTYGVAKNVNIKSVKVGSTFGIVNSAAIAGINWATGNHLANPLTPAVANISWEMQAGTLDSVAIDTAIRNSMVQGITYVIAAGNDNSDARLVSPADVTDALTVGAVDWLGNRPSFSNWGPGIDIWAPGVNVVSALTSSSLCFYDGSNSAECQLSGTSQAAPHVAGAVALYMQGKPGVTNCGAFPIDGPAPSGGNLSTCPDRVSRFIKATANLNRLTSSINGTLSSPNRFLLTSSAPGPANPIDNNQFFLWTQYADFLGREPDPAGFQAWLNILNTCPASGIDAGGNHCDRIEVSAGFFRSPEFQARGYFIYRFYSTLARIPGYAEWKTDFAKVSGFLTDQQLEAKKVAFANEFVARAEFVNRYGSTFNNPTAYVEALLQTVGFPSHPFHNYWIDGLTNGSLTRAQVLRGVIETVDVYNKYYNEAFVVMEYFGYLRRDPDAAYLAWIDIMNQSGGDYRNMVNGFMNSIEYRRRFGP
jgi:subtilisin family serine protease